MTFARWIDLGCPIDLGSDGDAPTAGSSTTCARRSTSACRAPGANAEPLSELRLGARRRHTGVDVATLSVTADFTVQGRAAGAELADLAVPQGGGRYTLGFGAPLGNAGRREVRVSVRDLQGNVTRVRRVFSTFAGGLFADAFEAGGTFAWSASRP